MLKLVDTHCVNLLHYLISGFFKKYFNYKEDIIQINLCYPYISEPNRPFRSNGGRTSGLAAKPLLFFYVYNGAFARFG